MGEIDSAKNFQGTFYHDNLISNVYSCGYSFDSLAKAIQNNLLNDSHPPLSNNWGQEVAFYFCLLFTRTLVLARVINPRRMRCRVTVVVLYVCVSICYQASCYIPCL